MAEFNIYNYGKVVSDSPTANEATTNQAQNSSSRIKNTRYCNAVFWWF